MRDHGAPKQSETPNLPLALTSFVGRATEIAEVRRLLAGTRLLTLTGAGGSGKTRLALEVAGALASDYPHGVWFVELAAITDAQLIPGAVAGTFGIRERPDQAAAESLVAALKSKTLLLVLDSCEHLVSACAAFAEALLRGCPRLRILATSREPLGIMGETQWRVPPLSLPDPRSARRVERPADFEAVQLFRERAKASLASFEITERNAPAVLEICARLDGIPLAIELAAARVRAFGVEEIAARLGDRLLAGSRSTANPRHQTLQAVTDWSYQLLAESERAVFRRLAVFAGGWTLRAAEAVCAGSAEPADGLPDLLMHLVDKSLVMADTREGEARYRLLETVRQYALEKLAESGEERETRRRHRDWYRDLAVRAGPHLAGRDQKQWLDRLEIEHDNFRAALDFNRGEDNGAGPELDLAGTLYWFWFLHGHWSEGRRRLEGALARSAEADRSVLPNALQGAMFFAWRQGDFTRAIALGEQGLTVCLAQGDNRGRARLLTWLALAALQRGSGRQAARWAEQSLAVARQLGDKWLLSLALGNLGTVARHEGDYSRAADYYGECLALAREVEDNFRISYSLRNIGIVALHQGNYDRASAAYKESLIVGRDIGDRWVAEECFLGLARVASARGEHEQAARLLGVADGLRDALGHRLSPIDQADYDECVARTRRGLGEVRFVAVLAQGKAMAVDEAVTYALIPTVARSPGKQPGALTPRELEVAALVARGSTNREIAAHLGVSPRTVDVHVEHILTKLGAKSRSQIAVWAAEHRVPLARSEDASSSPRGA
ncbi:MAG TPA: tetratricopeptide repeat protein [bacterium]|nr:tetratricopeptide repeat protein [bacterium]